MVRTYLYKPDGKYSVNLTRNNFHSRKGDVLFVLDSASSGTWNWTGGYLECKITKTTIDNIETPKGKYNEENFRKTPKFADKVYKYRIDLLTSKVLLYTDEDGAQFGAVRIES